ncbi:MAG: ThuA domain-containing protein [Halioglobus sp.]|nr:ThuA domain-containing protein [Halioglobus sp.]
MAHSSQATTSPPLKVLILTSPGVYHNYELQTQALAYALAERVHVQVDVSLAEVERWKTTDFAQGYDVLIYNICMADNQDETLIANLRRQSEVLGVPALVIHCAMHSFRETDLWWPMFGLQTKTHESLRPLTQIQTAPHPILNGIPKNWTVGNDELYINLQFEALTLLSVISADNRPHTTAWLAYQGATPIFGTTLGHSDETLDDPAFQRLIANAVLFVTGNLSDQGAVADRLDPVSNTINIIDTVSAPEGVVFLGETGKDCAYRQLAIAAGPCYLGCILNPLEWGEATQICKRSCERKLPSSDDIISTCSPDAQSNPLPVSP